MYTNDTLRIRVFRATDVLKKVEKENKYDHENVLSICDFNDVRIRMHR